MNWEDVRYVTVIARAGTLTGAADKLGVDQSTMSRRLRQIEKKAGLKLFLRNGFELAATEPGKRIVSLGQRMERQFDNLADLLEDESGPQGLVRISAMPWVVNRLLIPALPPFVSHYPRIKIETISGVRERSLSRGEADIALRFEIMPRGTELCYPIGKITYSVYIKRNLDSENTPWIGYGGDVAQTAPKRWSKSNADRAVVMSNDAGASMIAVEQGLGKALLPDLLASGSKRLKKVTTSETPELTRILRLLVHPDIANQRHVATTTEWLSHLLEPLSVQ